MIEIKDIEQLATLARLSVSPEEKESLRKDIDSILAYVDQIKAVSADVGDATMGSVLPRNVLREDANPHESGIFTEILLSAAPARQGNYVSVKKIL